MANKATDCFKLKNKNGVEITFTAQAGRLISILVPSASGKIDDVVIGYDTVAEALAGDVYFGAICGRYANRVSKGQFTLDGQDYQLEVNNGPNHLHGGSDGFNTRTWNVEPIKKEGVASAYKLTLVSADGDQKYPGELSVSVVYSLSDDNQFKIEYEAETSKPTIINLTCHPYFNLDGAGNGNILEHKLQLNADNYTPISPKLETCDGKIEKVAGTPMDFTSPKKLGEAVRSTADQIRLVDGLDHNFVIDNGGEKVILAAKLSSEKSGRTIEVYTDQPGIQIYTGNHFDSTSKGKQGRLIEKYGGVAMETQIFPNSPNVEAFPNATLRPGEVYKHTCIYKFVW